MVAIQIAMPVMFGLQAYVAPDAEGMYLEPEENHRRWELIGDPVVLGEYDGEGYGEWAESNLLDSEMDAGYPWADEIEVEPSAKICPECDNLMHECCCLPF